MSYGHPADRPLATYSATDLQARSGQSRPGVNAHHLIDYQINRCSLEVGPIASGSVAAGAAQVSHR